MLHYTTSGSGTPVILLHGFLSSHTYWDNLREKLRPHYQVIAIDLLGFGQSPKPADSPYTLAAHADAVRQTIYQLIGTDTPFILVGHSMGGLVACEIARQLPPALVSKLIVYNMPLFRHPVQTRRAFRRAGIVQWMSLYGRTSPLLWTIAKILLKPTFMRQLAYTHRPSLESVTAHTPQSRIRSLRNTLELTDGVRLLNSVRQLTTFVYGTRDRLLLSQNLTQLNRTNTLTLHAVDSGHHTLRDQPELLYQLLSLKPSDDFIKPLS